MRTIIINTLGSELRQNPLFFMSFPKDRFHWMEQPLEGIGTCVDQICSYNDEQDKKQDCHLVVLVSLARYQQARHAEHRRAYEEILFAHLNQSLLLPLVQERRQTLTGVSVVYVLPQPVDGVGEVPPEDINLYTLGVDVATMQVPETLGLTDDSGIRTVDLTGLFDSILQVYRQSYTHEQGEGLRGDSESGNNLRQDVANKLATLQECRYRPAGQETLEILPTEKVEFCPKETGWDFFDIDLQLNLSEHMAGELHSRNRTWKLKLTAHTSDEMGEKINLALARVQYLQNESVGNVFHRLEVAELGVEETFNAEIWSTLLEKVKLPGIDESGKDAVQEAYDLEQAGQADGTPEVVRKLRSSWLLIGREKKRFDKLCGILEEQYAPDAADKQQKDVLSTCAQVFSNWRKQVLSRRTTLPREGTQANMPAFDSAACEQALAEAQNKWGQVNVAELEDYTDVRQEAEQIKADFRKAFRLWPDGEFNATSKFVAYSCVLALLFLLQMLIPFVGITLGQSGVALSRFAHMGSSVVLFVLLYAAGVLLWMRSLCRQLARCSQRMYFLLQQSHARRRDSIRRTVNTYGTVLPQCTLAYERLQGLKRLHEDNLQRKERVNTHLNLLAKAEELLFELRTMLRLRAEPPRGSFKPKNNIDFEKAPSDEANVLCYAFLSEKWGER